MMSPRFVVPVGCVLLALPALALAQGPAQTANRIGSEVSVDRRLADGEEFQLTPNELFDHGHALFNARWTTDEGGGRPQTTGTGAALKDPLRPLDFPRNFNRISAPDANGCISCHNLPASGGGGDFTTNVFVLAQRFDFATFNADDGGTTVGSVDENGDFVDLDTIGNSRATLGMNGSGYIEMLARQMTADLQAIKAGIAPGEFAQLTTKGVSFGVLARDPDGGWDTSNVEGLPAPSLVGDDPNLVVRPFHQAGAVVSLRQFTNGAMNHHHGIQPTERFGDGDPDTDGFLEEMSRADVTAISVYQALLPVPGRVIPRDPEVEAAVLQGERSFVDLGCSRCHSPALPLDEQGNVYSEPNPYNPPGNLQVGDAESLFIDLNDPTLPTPRLHAEGNVTWVPAYTDLKLHDITSGEDDPNREVLNMHFAPGSVEFFEGNSRFLTKKLWGAANEPPYFHHGKFTTLRQAILAHSGEAIVERQAFEAATDYERDAVIEFLKTLQVLPQGVRHRFVDEDFRPRAWPPAGEDTPLAERSDRRAAIRTSP